MRFLNYHNKISFASHLKHSRLELQLMSIPCEVFKSACSDIEVHVCPLCFDTTIFVVCQGILKGEVSLYSWPPVLLVWNQLYGNWQFLFLFSKQTHPNQSNGGSTVQWYFPLKYCLGLPMPSTVFAVLYLLRNVSLKWSGVLTASVLTDNIRL